MRPFAVATLIIASICARAQDRIRDVIYLKQGGCAYTLDVFKSKTPNHKAIVFMVSGGWVSSHEGINPAMAKPLNDRGFTVFEVVHGSQPKYTISEIVPEVRRAVRFVRANAASYDIDPNAIGVTGISSGGHLSLEIGGLGDDGNPTATDPVERVSSRVQAVVAFMPPTDFLNWGEEGKTPFHMANMDQFMPAFGVNPQTPDDVVQKIGHDTSPIILVKSGFPPTLLVHGDADKLVPLQQSKKLDAAFETVGITHKLVIVPGGDHGFRTVIGGLSQALDWFDVNLKVGKS
jgi:acetyl esterase/lipase